MPETCRDIYDNKSQLFHQVGTSRHFTVMYFMPIFMNVSVWEQHTEGQNCDKQQYY